MASQTTLNSSMSSLSMYAPSSVTSPMDTVNEEGTVEEPSKPDALAEVEDPTTCRVCVKRDSKVRHTGVRLN